MTDVHDRREPPHALYRPGDLPLESGQVIRDFELSYITRGTLDEARSNAVLVVPSLGGDYYRALRSIRARTLIMVGEEDLLNPDAEAVEAARHIPGARCVRINPPAVPEHAAAAGSGAAENDHLDREIGRFLGLVTQGKGSGSPGVERKI